MKTSLILVILLITGCLFAGDEQAKKQEQKAAPAKTQGQKIQLIFPENLKPGPLRIELISPTKLQEFVEVKARAYPGLDLDLPALNEVIRFQPKPIPKPAHDNQYYQAGGAVLASWGIYLHPSGELVNSGNLPK